MLIAFNIHKLSTNDEKKIILEEKTLHNPKLANRYYFDIFQITQGHQPQKW